MRKEISILWGEGSPEGSLTVTKGNISMIKVSAGNGETRGMMFGFKSEGECRLTLKIDDAALDTGANSTVVSVITSNDPFSFFLRDVSSQYPIYIPEYRVIVTNSDDKRLYKEISADIESRAARSKLEVIESEMEESFENASRYTRDLQCPTWLGLSRDIRIFEIGFRGITYCGPEREAWDWIKPRYHGKDVTLPELNGMPVRYDYFAGRGLGCVQRLERRLEDGILPILNAEYDDDDVSYRTKMFVTYEKSPLTMENVRGTNYLVTDEYSICSMFTEEQEKTMKSLHEQEIERDEESVIYIRIQAVNLAEASRYCWMRIPQPNLKSLQHLSQWASLYEKESGFGLFQKDRVFLIATLNGKPVPQREMAVLLKPGEKVEYIFKIPHRPISEIRAEALAKRDFDQCYNECKDFWRKKLLEAAQFSVPEKRIDEMMKAGILHLDLVCYGNEPDGPVAPVVGVYSPIGSESSPMIQYLDSIGKHDLAQRAIMYFINKQHPDGFMQNFGGYMLETGMVLWNIGEHYRYTQNTEWIRSIQDNIIKACDYLILWSERNKKEELRGRGFGMIEGKVADPEDPFHSYMLNGSAYIGLARSAEVLSVIAHEQSGRIADKASELKENIRFSLQQSIAECPVIPLGNGSWCPSVSPWTENRGPVCLHAEDGEWFTHGSIAVRDSLCGAMYLLLTEVVKPNEQYGEYILKSFAELFHMCNVALSQPYYSPHPYAHLKRGEVKAFLKEYYNGLSSLADRETYTFWEHFYHVSPHKTHEEGWFLMRSRWMLYMEDGDTLNLLPGVPRAWLEDAKCISVQGMQTYYGPLYMEVKSDLGNGKVNIAVKVDAQAPRLPVKIKIRIPHPLMIKASKTSLGEYCPKSETVTIVDFKGSANFEVVF